VTVYYNIPHTFNEDELRHAEAIADQVTFAIERKGSEDALRQSEARLRSALDAGKLGVWEWTYPPITSPGQNACSNFTEWTQPHSPARGLFF